MRHPRKQMKWKMAATGKTSPRLGYVDVAKGIALLSVFCGHHGLMPGGMTDWFWSFHMPLFFVVTGLFSSRLTSQPFTAILKDGLLKLVIPLLLAEALLDVGILVMTHQTATLLHPFRLLAFIGEGFVDMQRPMWFLMALFYGRTVISLLFTPPIHECTRLIGVILLFIIGWKAGELLAADYVCLFKGLLSPLFIYAGILIRRAGVLSRFGSPIVVVASVMLLLSAWRARIDFWSFSFPLGLISAAVAVALSVAFLCLIREISERHCRATGWLTRFFAWMGRNTLYILCAHSMELTLKLHRFVPGLDSQEQCWAVLAVILLTIPIVKRIPVISKIYQLK